MSISENRYKPPPPECEHGRPTSLCAICAPLADARYRAWKAAQPNKAPAELSPGDVAQVSSSAAGVAGWPDVAGCLFVVSSVTDHFVNGYLPLPAGRSPVLFALPRSMPIRRVGPALSWGAP